MIREVKSNTQMSKWSTQACQSNSDSYNPVHALVFSTCLVFQLTLIKIFFLSLRVKMRERTGKALAKSITSYRNIWKVIGNYKNTHRNYVD